MVKTLALYEADPHLLPGAIYGAQNSTRSDPRAQSAVAQKTNTKQKKKILFLMYQSLNTRDRTVSWEIDAIRC